VINHTFVLKSFIKASAPEFGTLKLKSSAEACERFSVWLRLFTVRRTLTFWLVDLEFFTLSKFEGFKGAKSLG